MKKYGVYAACSNGKNEAFLIREYSSLKDAVTEAFRLSRCRYHHRSVQLIDTFIAGDNTGITLNRKAAYEYIRYSVEHCIIFDDVFGFLEISGGQAGVRHTFLVKAGII